MQASPQMSSSENDAQEEALNSSKFLTFVIGDACYGLDIAHVTEIIGLQKITAMPDVPTYIKGVINLRGNVIPVMDVRSRFGLMNRDYDDRTCIIVIHVESTSIGLVVDTVSEVLDIDHANIQPPPSMGSDTSSCYISGLGKVDTDVKVLLDARRLLNLSDIDLSTLQ